MTVISLANTSPFVFEWAVDQDGYLIDGGVIRAVGGPLRFYRPLEQHPDLWLRFADTCVSAETVLAFARDYGLLYGFFPFSADAIANPSPQTGPFNPSAGGSPIRAEIAWEQRRRLPRDFTPEEMADPRYWSEFVGEICRRAEEIRHVKSAIIAGNRREAANMLNSYELQVRQLLDNHSGKFEIRVVPLTLHAALLHQACETVALNHRWERCRNDGCPNWWRRGTPKGTVRKQYCSDKCRVAAARKHKHDQGAQPNA